MEMGIEAPTLDLRAAFEARQNTENAWKTNINSSRDTVATKVANEIFKRFVELVSDCASSPMYKLGTKENPLKVRFSMDYSNCDKAFVAALPEDSVIREWVVPKEQPNEEDGVQLEVHVKSGKIKGLGISHSRPVDTDALNAYIAIIGTLAHSKLKTKLETLKNEPENVGMLNVATKWTIPGGHSRNYYYSKLSSPSGTQGITVTAWAEPNATQVQADAEGQTTGKKNKGGFFSSFKTRS